MSRTEFARLDEVFNAALELDERGRAALLAELKEQDPTMAARLHAMLAADGCQDDRLRASVVQAASDLPVSQPSRIGPFDVIRQLGRGGMGAVYLCRRRDGDFEQRLAVKRLSLASDSALIRERLKLERRMLARLRHPHIAQLIDGGEDKDGTPWVALEFVEGLPIDRHVEEKRLSCPARVALLQQLCVAVQFAHRNLIIHRDIKPDNVLVDHHGQVKLLDFGIAKLLGEGEASRDDAVPTVAGAMTPHYASPEQVRGEPVSQASDIYSLGVLLYQLVSGQRPYQLNTSRPSEIERIVCERDPPPPSALTGQRGARARDLDAIVLKAMHKAPERRYDSAAELAADLDRWQNGRAVQAQADSVTYRLGTFVRRHPLGTGVAALSLVLLMGFAAAMSWQAERVARERDVATREARIAEETAGFLIELFSASDPRVSNATDLLARDLLEIAAERLPSALASDPLARARLMHTIGLAFANMGDERGTELLAEALALRERHAGPDSAEVADSLNRLGNIHRQFGRLEQAEAMLVQALDWRLRNGPVDEDLADSHNNLGLLQTDLGHHAEAEATLRTAIALHREAAGADTDNVVSPQHNLAIALRAQDRLEEAREVALESVQRKRRAGTRAASLATTLAVLANIERRLGHTDAALLNSSESLALRREVYGNDSPMLASGLVTHAGALAAANRRDEARAAFDEAFALFRTSVERNSLGAANTHFGYGNFLLEQGDIASARGQLQRAYQIVINHHPEGGAVINRYREALQALPPQH